MKFAKGCERRGLHTIATPYSGIRVREMYHSGPGRFTGATNKAGPRSLGGFWKRFYIFLAPECQNHNLKMILSPVASFSQSFSPFELTATHFGPETVIFGRPETRTSVIGDLKS